MKKLYILFLLAIIIGGCGAASTDLSGFLSPDYKGEKIGKIMVFVNLSDLTMRQPAEEEIVLSIKMKQVKAFSSLTLFSPAKEYTKEEMDETIKREKVDAILFIELTDYAESQTYVPKTDYYSFGKKSATKYEFGGYNVSKPVISVKSTLVSTQYGYNIWVANSVTGGNAFARVRDIASSLGDEIIDDLKEKRVIK